MSRMVLRVLSDAEIEKLHQKTLDVFENTGIKITHDEALRKLKKAGANVDETSGIAKFPSKMVEELLQLAPSVAKATGINGKMLEIGGDNRYYSSLILDPIIVDCRDGPRRPVLEDVRRHTIIGESLDRVDSMMRMQYPVEGIPEPDCYYKTMEVFLSLTAKQVHAMPTSAENCREWMEVMALIAEASGLDADKTPLLSLSVAITSPLQIHGPNIEIMKMGVQRCYPLIPTVCPMAGTTAPYSVAATVLVSNVEALALVLLTQVYKPGHPVMYSVGPSVTDMKTGRDLYYNASKMLFKTASIQMAKHYNLPASSSAGGTLTFRADVQNGAESLAYLLSSYTSGQNLIGGLGSLHNANGMSAEQIIMQCGLVDMVEYMARGIDMSDKKLAVESIKNAGPGGNFLADDLTVELLRSDEFFTSEYMDMTGGYIEGAPGMYEIAHQKAEELVCSYKPTVPEKIREEIKRYFSSKYQSPKTKNL